MNSTELIWVGLAALAMACFAATAVQAFRDFSRAQLRELLRNRNLLPRYDEIIQYHRQAASGAESLRVFASAGAVVSAAAFLWNTQSEHSSWLAGLAVTVSEIIGGAAILWLAIVWLPSVLARLWAEPLIARTWPIWRSAGKLLAPSAAGTDFVERAVHRISGKEQTSHSEQEQELEEEIREVVTEGQREGLIEEDAREMIESVMGLGEVVVSEIMTPRTDMVSIPINLELGRGAATGDCVGPHALAGVWRKPRRSGWRFAHQRHAAGNGSCAKVRPSPDCRFATTTVFCA